MESETGPDPARPAVLSRPERLIRTWRTRREARRSSRRLGAFRDRALTAGEIAILVFWTLVVTHPYLNLDPEAPPDGREFLASIQTHHIWTWVRACGACGMWFGSVNGGWPVAVDVNAATFHPLVALTTLGWGVSNGAKLALVGGFFIAGLAQWWLARVLGLGRVARTWSACVAVAGGHLASRMDLGHTGLILATASASLVWPPLIALARTGRYRNAVLLGVALGLLAVSGGGYLQVGMAFLLPLTLLLLPRERQGLVRKYGLAIGIGGLLAAPVLVPFLHFFPQFAKDAEPTYSSAQPLAYLPLNLVIDDFEFYISGALHRAPWAWPYAIFIGWVPVLLAIWALRGHRDGEERRIVTFLVATSALAFWLASAGPFRILLKAHSFFPPVDVLAGLRYIGVLAGLAVSPILGLAAIGLDRLLTHRWPSVQVTEAGPASGYSFDLRWLVAIPLVAALLAARNFSMHYIRVLPPLRDAPAVLSALRTNDLEWVSTPYGEQFWTESAIRRGLKLARNAYLTWHWRDRPSPEPVLVATRGGPPPGMIPRAVVAGIQIVAAPPGQEYASVLHAGGQRTVCHGHGTGGDIDVVCNLPSPGVLTVKENSWSGWHASASKGKLSLLPGQWLSVQLPAGRSTVRFRYRPWDVPLGLLLCLGGVGLGVREWLLDRYEATPRP